MKLHIHLLHNIHNKLKQPYNDLNLELSYSLNHKEDYYIDSYSKYYLIKINTYKSKENIIFNYPEVRIIKHLRRRIDIHYNDDYLLRWASEYGHLKIVKLLLQQKADVNACNDWPLRFASGKGHLEVVKVLLQHGANIHALDDYALRCASTKDHSEVVKFLLQNGANIHADNDCALIWASRNGHLKVVKLLKSYM